jgi:sarcosine/dimethylglycine N-methyltransferase
VNDHFADILRQYASPGGSEFYRQVMGGGGAAIHYGIYPDDATTMAQATLLATRELLELAGHPACDRVLDLGSGRGAAAHELAMALGCVVTAVDCCQPLLDENAERARQAGIGERIECACLSFEELPDDWTERYDLVWSQEAICHARHPQAVFDHAWRVLKPGGRMVFSDIFSREAKETAATVFNRVNAVSQLSTVRGTEQMLRRAGFIDIARADRTDHLHGNFKRMLERIRGNEDHFIAAGLDPEWLRAFKDSLMSRLRWKPGEGLEWVAFTAIKEGPPAQTKVPPVRPLIV